MLKKLLVLIWLLSFSASANIASLGERSAFNEQITKSRKSIVRASPVYGLMPANFRTFTSGGGAATVVNNEFKASSGTATADYGTIQSFRSLSAIYGSSTGIRFGARFPSSTANTWQGVGLFTIGDEVSFGYNGTSFGVWHRYDGLAEVRTITVSGGAGGSETLTLTLNGVEYSIPLTSGSAADNAQEIAVWLRANQSVWDAYQTGSTVEISALSDGAKSGSYSFSSSTATGSIAQNTAGVTKTSDFIAQTAFNGTVPSGFDQSKGQTYQIVYQTGYGDIMYQIYDWNRGSWVTAHKIENNNGSTGPALRNASLHAGLYATAIGATSNVDVYASYLNGFVHSASKETRNPRAFKNTKLVSTSLTNVLTIRTRRVYNGYINQAEISPVFLSVANESTKNVEVEIRGNPTVAGTKNYQDVGTNLISQSEVAGTTVTTDGRLLAAFTLAGGTTATINLKELNIQIPPTLNFVVAAKVNSGASANVTAALSWIEDI